MVQSGNADIKWRITTAPRTADIKQCICVSVSVQRELPPNGGMVENGKIALQLSKLLNLFHTQGALPKTILYSLNSNACKEIAVIAGSFDNVKLGPAWWLNDTRLGNREMMEIIAEYSTIGTFLGMLTDSRSFSSYVRFDFFRRILADFVGEYVQRGEFDKDSAFQLMQDVCYNNIKNFLDV